MTAKILRKEIHNIIDDIPDQNLSALKPILTQLADEYWKPVFEPATAEDHAKIKKVRKEYRKHPENFTPLSEIIKADSATESVGLWERIKSVFTR